MTADDVVSVRRVPAPRLSPDTVAVVAQALLPLLYWRSVPVLREKRQELTVLERFVLETGLALGAVESADFTEITSLPASVLAGAAWRLVSCGALLSRGGSYGVNPELAAATLQQQVVRRLVRSSADFVLLPRSGDLLAVAGRDGGWLRELEQKLVADRQAPLPSALRAAERGAYLGEQVRARAVHGLDRAVVDVPVPASGDIPLVSPGGRQGDPELRLCPAYLCRAEIRRTGAGTHVIDAVAAGRPRRGRTADAGTAADDMVEVEIDLTGADRLAATWLKLADALDDEQTRGAAWREIGPPSTGCGRPPLDGFRRRGPAEWDLIVNGAATRALCEQDRPLAEPRGLAIEAEGVIIHVACRFIPSDDEARSLFARDEVIAQLLAAQRPAAEFPAACQEVAVRFPGMPDVISADSIRERIWQLGHHHLVYMLREDTDFSYD